MRAGKAGAEGAAPVGRPTQDGRETGNRQRRAIGSDAPTVTPSTRAGLTVIEWCADEGCVFAVLHPEHPRHTHNAPKGICWQDGDPCEPTCGPWSGCRYG